MSSLAGVSGKTGNGSFFGTREKGSTLGTEIRAGTTTFATLVYIIIVQPSIMAACGMPQDAVFTATVIGSGLATLMMGIYGRFPFALATAMGTNAIFAFSIVAPGIATWETAMGMIFVSGIIFMLLSFPILRWLWLFGVRDPKILNFSCREAVTNNIPLGLKLGLGAAIGVFLMRLGSESIGLTGIVNGSLSFGDLRNPVVLIGFICLVLTILMFFVQKQVGGRLWKISGAVLIGIALTSAVLFITGLAPLPQAVISLPPNISPIFFKLNILDALQPKYWTYIFIFFLGDFFSTAGTSLACGAKAGFMDKVTGDMPGIERVFQVDSLWTVIGSFLGLTTITTFVESASGVEDGGRTGITSIVTAGWFALALFFSPVFLAIPGAASGVALVLVGLSMMQVLADIPYRDIVETIPVLVMVGITACSGDFAAALCVSLVVYGAFVIARWIVENVAALKDPAHADPKALAAMRPTAMTLVLMVMSILKFVITV
ncbi:MAG: NCS2 family permease [Treponema sp.]|jgi:AGZA family xanthine/uracil permease-like MFS transporter|nr:NCS2 family permease [Treponema sp.]